MTLTVPAPKALAARAFREVVGAPLTGLLLLALTGTTVALGRISDPHLVLERLSSNVVNLGRFPLRSLIGSALVLSGGGLLFYAVTLALTLGVLERHFGWLRALAVFGSGHVLATLLTEGGVWVGIRAGLLPWHDRHQIDVGVSYGLMACTGAVLILLPTRVRFAAAAGVVVWTVGALAADPDMTSTGHLVALIIGFCWWPVLRRIIDKPRQGEFGQERKTMSRLQPINA